MSIIVLSNHTRIGAWVNRKMQGGGKNTINSILYNIINCHAQVSHKHRIHGKLGLQLCLKKIQNARRPSEFVTLHLGSDGCH